MASGWRDAAVMCPYYKRSESMAVRCEGLTDDSGIRLLFQDKSSYQIHLRTFCRCHYERCELFEAIRKAKYEEG